MASNPADLAGGPRPPLHEVVPPLVLGTATFNAQYVWDPYNPTDLPALSIVSRALDLGLRAFDTSPYYGPSETILGEALAHPTNVARHPRSSYFLLTKAGRVAGDEFDYSPSWIRYSVLRSLERLHTSYLDLVYMHDVEFVSPAEVLAAIIEMRRLRTEGLLRYVGICGFPIEKLCELAEMVLRETGEPLDAVQTYGHYTIQNMPLGSDEMLARLSNAGVSVVTNASMLGMGLLTTRGVDAGPQAGWHPSPKALRQKVREMLPVVAEAGEKLEVVAIRWSLDNWSRTGAKVGSSKGPGGQRVGVNVMGVTSVPELEETWRVFRSVMEGLDLDNTDEEAVKRRDWSLARKEKVQSVVERIWVVLGEWKDYSWCSPDPGFVNKRKLEEKGVVPDDGILARHEQKLPMNVRVRVHEVVA